MINFSDTVDLNECSSKEDLAISFFWRSVYITIYAAGGTQIFMVEEPFMTE